MIGRGRALFRGEDGGGSDSFSRFTLQYVSGTEVALHDVRACQTGKVNWVLGVSERSGLERRRVPARRKSLSLED